MELTTRECSTKRIWSRSIKRNINERALKKFKHQEMYNLNGGLICWSMNSLTDDNLTSEENCSVRVEPSGKRNCSRENALRAAEALSRWSCSWALWAARRRSSSLVWAAWYRAARSILSWAIFCRIFSKASFSSRFSFWRESASSRCSRSRCASLNCWSCLPNSRRSRSLIFSFSRSSSIFFSRTLENKNIN